MSRFSFSGRPQYTERPALRENFHPTEAGWMVPGEGAVTSDSKFHRPVHPVRAEAAAMSTFSHATAIQAVKAAARETATPKSRDSV